MAKDVCEVLGYADPDQAVRRHCKYARTLKPVETTDLHPRTKVIPESDLYRLILRSNMPNAVDFQDWVTETVLPSIRKTGGYIFGEEKMSEDELILATMQMLQRKVEAQKTLLAKQAPKVQYFDNFISSSGLFNFTDDAKVFHIPATALTKLLRNHRYLSKARDWTGNFANKPIQKWLDAGYFEVKDWAKQTKKGVIVGAQTFITPAGMEYFSKWVPGVFVRRRPRMSA